jgi:cyanophycin synthetase
MQAVTSRAVRWQALGYKVATRWQERRGSPARGDGRSTFYRSLWQEAAAAVGAPITYPDDYYAEIRLPGSVLRVHDHITSLDDLATGTIAANKPLVDRLLAARGLPVPRSVVCRFDDARTGWAFAGALGCSCVVKPARGTGGGTGITTGVSGKVALVAAMARAGGHCHDVIIEEHLPGDNYRLLYLDGELLDALQRRPPTLCGDGRATIKQLIAADDERLRERGVGLDRSPFAIDRELRRALRDSGRRLSTVPGSGELVRLKAVVSQNGTQYNEPVNDRVCPAVAQAGAQAAAAVGVRLAGVDVITTDPSVPLGASGGAIIEVNTTPGLHYHYMVTGEPTPVALLILQRLSEAAS